MMWRLCWVLALMLLAPARGPIAASQAATPSPSGSVPVAIEITSAHVLGRIEPVEVVGGVMQPPRNLAVAGWYSQLGRPGTPSNIVMTGYYYWSGLPSLFYELALVTEGDAITITGEAGEQYRYAVVWVRTYDKATAPLAEIVGPSRDEVLTLITDAGNINAATNAYSRSTVVRAERVSRA